MFTTTEENETALSLFSTYLDFIVALRLLQIFGGYGSDGGNSVNNKMILFYFHGSVKHFNIVNAYSVVDLIMLKAEPDC